MNLRDAIDRGEAMLLSGRVAGADAIAVRCLLEVARSVLRVQRPLRQLERTLCPQWHGNQEEMFGDQDED